MVKKAASDKCYKGHLHEGDSYIILQTKVRTALALHPARDRGYVQNKRYQFSLTKSPFCWLWAFFFPHCLHTALWLTLLRLSFDCGLGVSTAVVKREKVVVFAVLHLCCGAAVGDPARHAAASLDSFFFRPFCPLSPSLLCEFLTVVLLESMEDAGEMRGREEGRGLVPLPQREQKEGGRGRSLHSSASFFCSFFPLTSLSSYSRRVVLLQFLPVPCWSASKKTLSLEADCVVLLRCVRYHLRRLFLAFHLNDR